MWIGVLLSVVFLLDQGTKLYIKHAMELGETIPVLGNFLRITYIENPGIAFGLQIGNNLIFTSLSVIVSLGIALYLFTHLHESNYMKCSLAIILGGAFGNLLDRIHYGKVVDFVDIGFQSVRWPVFNVADSAVVIGMILLFITIFIVEGKKDKEEKQEIY